MAAGDQFMKKIHFGQRLRCGYYGNQASWLGRKLETERAHDADT